MESKKGVFSVVDGLDGVGKGEILRALDSYEQKLGKAVFDTISFSKANRKGLPELSDFWNPPEKYYDALITAEPTYAGIGHTIRNEIISKNRREYSAEDEIQSYSLDRLVQMKKTIIPAIANGLNILQGRCCAATLTYQSLRAQQEGKNLREIRKKILNHNGNRLQLSKEYRPDLIIIPTIKDTKELMERLRSRGRNGKEDNAIFEDLEFQERLKPLYESDWLRDIFETAGTKVAYLNAGMNVQDSRNQAVEIYSYFLKTEKVSETYTSLDSLPS